jgi:hypothetical protein
MKTRLRHALLASGLAAAFVGSLTVTSTVASAGPMAPAAALPPLKIQDAEVIRPLPEPWQAPVRGFRITGTFGAGEVIGAVGLTGNTTGPHVHIEVRPGGGDPIDPAAVLQGHRVAW